MIFCAPELLPECLQVIEEVDSIRARLRFALANPNRWMGLLRRTTLARAIRGSNSIEGYNVTRDDAVAVVDHEEPLEAGRETWAAVSGYRDALTYVLQLANDPYFEHSEALIRSLHFMMMSYDLAKHPGSWRPGPIYVRDEARQEIVFEGPGADDVPALMRELVEYLRRGVHTRSRALPLRPNPPQRPENSGFRLSR
jgi:Fic family protein